MPEMNAKTTKAKEVWKSPDGQRILYRVDLEIDGQPFEAKTYSNAIAAEGWEGKVETYEKTGRNGVETFVKQPQKDGGFSGASSARPAYKPKDDAAIQSMWAITKAIEWAANDKSIKLEDIEPLATDFYQMVDEVKANTAKPGQEKLAIAEVDPKQLDIIVEMKEEK